MMKSFLTFHCYPAAGLEFMQLPREQSPPDRWFVTNGVVVVGPVAFGVLTHGVVSGRIPQGSLVRHESWNVWRGFDDVEGLSSAGLKATVSELAHLSSQLEERAAGPLSDPPPPPSREQLVSELSKSPRQDTNATPRQPRVDPVGVLSHAETLQAALPLTLSTVAKAVAADIALLHRVRMDLGSTVTMYTHGVGTEHLLGEKLLEGDPTLSAARANRTVIVEPEPGEVGRHIAGRLGRSAEGLRGMAMIPLFVHGTLVVLVEVARIFRPFSAKDIGRAEDVLAVLGERAVVQGWFE
ncbi:MAG: GAF domain-containing protein [Polyangiaceae bacterium]|nr:GAF domain-containing protein [Polyangiaceae bacterium]